MEIFSKIPEPLIINIIKEAKPFVGTVENINELLMKDVIFTEYYIKNCMSGVNIHKFNYLFLYCCTSGFTQLINLLLRYHSEKLTLRLIRKCINEIICNKTKKNESYNKIILMLKSHIDFHIWIAMVLPWTIERKDVKLMSKILKLGSQHFIYNFKDIIKYNSFIAVELDFLCCNLILLSWLSKYINPNDFDIHLRKMMSLSIKHNANMHFNILIDILNDNDILGPLLLQSLESRNINFTLRILEYIDINKWGFIGLSKIGSLKNRSYDENKLYETLLDAISNKHILAKQLTEKKQYILKKINDGYQVFLNINSLYNLGIKTSLFIIHII